MRSGSAPSTLFLFRFLSFRLSLLPSVSASPGCLCPRTGVGVSVAEEKCISVSSCSQYQTVFTTWIVEAIGCDVGSEVR